MGLKEEYVCYAREAQRMAENSRNRRDRAGWLRIAEQWLRMLRTERGDETAQGTQMDWPAGMDGGFESSDWDARSQPDVN